MSNANERDVFAAALECETDAARAAYIAHACGNDAALRQRVEQLLAASDCAGDFLEAPPTVLSGSEPALRRDASEQPGDRIGRYKLLEQIGEGGCGVVYMADQEEPVRRRVALKVIKLGMDTKSVIARFEAERQALALMDHPNIAKVFDGGATDQGRPYFVLELVRGVRITDFCDQARLSTEARLNLFVQVCQAIQHAHQKGIIHRDLKPSNILVTINDGMPVPKVIDFGIAKATGQQLTDKTLFTQFHSFIGTPAYTSPEQAEMSSVDIDTRSDIYSLGVLLYELLTGHTPFDGEELLRSGLDEMRRVIRNEEPPKPSTRLTILARTAAVERSTPRVTREIINAVRGDLDWIVMKCLEKDRGRRYVTANDLVADIGRHLSNQAVTARSPSTPYLLWKFAQRHRGMLLAATFTLSALLAAVFALALGNARIRTERNQKEQALRDRSVALESARTSEHQAREQLFVSLQSQAQARRDSRQAGQRVESLDALAQAARIRPNADLRDNAIAALTIPDVQFGTSWRGLEGGYKGAAHDPLRERYARVELDGAISIRSIGENRELKRLAANSVTGAASRSGTLTFSPDGRLICWRDEQGRVGVWSCDSGEAVLKNAPTTGSAHAFSPDSRRMALADGASIRCFDLISGERIFEWPARDSVFAMEFHPDGRRIAVGYWNAGAVAVYNSDDGTRSVNVPTGGSAQTIVAWHPDGELLAAGGSDARIHIWNIAERRKVAVLEGHVGHMTFLKFHPRGDLLASVALDGLLHLWHPVPGRLWLRVPMSGWIDLHGPGAWAGLATPSPGTAQVWRIIPGEEYHTFLNLFEPNGNPLGEGSISPDGQWLAVAMTGGARVWDIARGREVARLVEALAVEFSADGRELFTTGPTNVLQRWPITRAAGALGIGPPRAVQLPFKPHRLQHCAQNTLAVVSEDAGHVALLDLSNESVRPQVHAHGSVSFLNVSTDGKRLLTSGWHTDEVKLWDTTSGALVKTWTSGKQSRAFMSPAGEVIIARGQEITFHAPPAFEVTRKLPRERGLYPSYVVFTRDGKLSALEMAPGVIHLCEPTSGRTIAKLEDPWGDQSSWMEFTPDGTQLIVISQFAGAIHRWDLRALRVRLKAMNLDWDWPDYPAAAASAPLFPRRMEVLGVSSTNASIIR